MKKNCCLTEQHQVPKSYTNLHTKMNRFLFLFC